MDNELEQARENTFQRQNNSAADVNRSLRDFTAPRAYEIHLGYTAFNINVEEYQIPPA
jgi:hypothetical protein